MLSKILDLSFLDIIKDDFIDLKKSLVYEYKRGFLYDDMFLAKSKHLNLLLDIGWISDNDSFENGYFKIVVIENEDWGTPLINFKANEKDAFIKKVNIALSFFKKHEEISI